MSFIRTHLETERDRKFVLIHAVYASWDLGYRAEIEALRRRYKNLYYIPTISRPVADPNYDGYHDRIEEMITNGIIKKRCQITLDPSDTHVYLCGNPKMIEGVGDLLVTKGFTMDKGRVIGNIHKEEYW